MKPHLADLPAIIKCIFDVLDLVVLRVAMLGSTVVVVYKILKAR
jgi:hypothetical protein